MSRARRDRNPRPEPLEYAAACQRAMHEAIGERSRAFLSAANEGWTMQQIAQAVGLSPAGVHKIIVREEELALGGYEHVSPSSAAPGDGR